MSIVMGLDLSSSSTGYGIIDTDFKVITFGDIRPSVAFNHGQKYHCIRSIVDKLIEDNHVDTLILERYFVGGFKSFGTFICAELRGCIKELVSSKYQNINILEYFPSSLKKVITGNGKAIKAEVAKSVLQALAINYTELKGSGNKCTFIINEKKYHDDCSDALSLAYYHVTVGRGNE